MELVSNIEQISGNLAELERARTSTTGREAAEYIALIENGICFCSYNTEEGLAFGPSRFLGYENNHIARHHGNTERDGRETNERISQIIGHEPETNDVLEMEFERFCSRVGAKYKPRPVFGNTRKFWRTAMAAGRKLTTTDAGQEPAAGESLQTGVPTWQRVFFRCHEHDYSNLTLDVLLDQKRRIAAGIPFCGWWGKIGSTAFYPLVVLPDGRIDFGSDDDTDQRCRYGHFDLHENLVAKDSPFNFDDGDDTYTLRVESVNDLTGPWKRG